MHAALRPGGWFAILGRVVVRREGEPEVYAHTADLHERFAPGVPEWGHPPTEAEAMPAIKNYFKAYATSEEVRYIIESKTYGDLATNPTLSLADFKAVPEKYRNLIPEYIKDYVSLNQFAA